MRGRSGEKANSGRNGLTPKLRRWRLVAVCFSLAGVFLVSYADLDLEGGFPTGALWALLGAACYSVYIVLLRRRVSNEENMDSPMFFGFVGLFNCALLWPGLLLVEARLDARFEATQHVVEADTIAQRRDARQVATIIPQLGPDHVELGPQTPGV